LLSSGFTVKERRGLKSCTGDSATNLGGITAQKSERPQLHRDCSLYTHKLSAHKKIKITDTDSCGETDVDKLFRECPAVYGPSNLINILK
jgi:hypothetical protein